MPKEKPIAKILVVDDEESMREFLDIMLSKEGYLVETADCYNRAIEIMSREKFDVVISDIKMPDISGIDLLKEIHSIDPETTAIMITAYASLDSAVQALREGAFDYITKPFEVSQIKFAVSRALENKRLREENRILREQIRTGGGGSLDEFVGESKAISEIKEFVKKIAPTDSSVLITGESGTGKNLIAKAIHKLSPRADGPFVAINCGAVPEQLLESELFGHMKGSFTGAIKDKEGLFSAATSGTLFLDEIGASSLAIQVKLLRALEEKEITPVGSTKPIKVDVRLLAATNADLADMVSKGSFREDLYYRLNVFHIHITPLRERREDILPTARFILEKLATRTEERVKKITRAAAKVLENAPWRGNVRELENILERALLMAETDSIGVDALPDSIGKAPRKIPEDISIKAPADFLPSMEIIEKAYIYWVLASTNWKKARAAEILGIDASTLYRKIEKYGLKEHIGD
ncbi:sigma-54-dependent Fis family transcriptional regulator [bacterium]|nr:MAG: sigma-54-dependent Fis family transcriptional regulator [bacterium]